MNPYSILPLVATLINFVVIYFTLFKSTWNTRNLALFLMSLLGVTWYGGFFILLNVNKDMVLDVARFAKLAPALYPTVFALFYFDFIKIRKFKFWLASIMLVCILAAYTLIFHTPLYINGLYEYPWGYYPKAAAGEIVMLFFSIFLALFLIIKFWFYMKAYSGELSSIEHNRMRYVFYSLFFTTLIIIDYLPTCGINVYPFIGSFSYILFIIILAYATIKHKLLDIDIILKKGIAYSMLVSIVTLLYFLIIFFLELMFRDVIGYKSIPITTLIICFFILIFQPLKNRIQFLVDKLFFKGSIVQIEQENMRLRTELEKSERLKAVGTLAAGMAHEIKNPLTGIKTFTEYLPKKYHDKEFIDKFQRIVGSEVNKINDIVAQLLDFAKPKPLEIKEAAIQNLMDETLDLLNNEFLKYRIEAIKIYHIDPIMKVDPTQIKQAFLNIILNAIDSMKPNGGKLVISIKKHLKNVAISFDDTGCGISKKDLAHLFDPFFTKKETNTGLGLSIVFGIIETHKGRIRVESELGKGTKFIIYLPSA